MSNSSAFSLSRPGLTEDTRGLTTVEYIVVLVLVAIGGIGLWQTFGGSVDARVSDSAERIKTMTGPGVGAAQHSDNGAERTEGSDSRDERTSSAQAASKQGAKKITD